MSTETLAIICNPSPPRTVDNRDTGVDQVRLARQQAQDPLGVTGIRRLADLRAIEKDHRIAADDESLGLMQRNRTRLAEGKVENFILDAQMSRDGFGEVGSDNFERQS